MPSAELGAAVEMDKKLMELAEKATPGEWALNPGKLEGLWHKSGKGYGMLCWTEEDKDGNLIETVGFRSGDKDMEFVAYARNHGPAIARTLIEQAAERDRLQGWVNDLQSGMFINCVYCGHRYGPDSCTPVAMANVLKAHIEICPQHPLSTMKRRAEMAEAALAERDAQFKVADDQAVSFAQVIAERDARIAKFEIALDKAQGLVGLLPRQGDHWERIMQFEAALTEAQP